VVEKYDPLRETHKRVEEEQARSLGGPEEPTRPPEPSPPSAQPSPQQTSQSAGLNLDDYDARLAKFEKRLEVLKQAGLIDGHDAFYRRIAFEDKELQRMREEDARLKREAAIAHGQQVDRSQGQPLPSKPDEKKKGDDKIAGVEMTEAQRARYNRLEDGDFRAAGKDLTQGRGGRE